MLCRLSVNWDWNNDTKKAHSKQGIICYLSELVYVFVWFLVCMIK